MESVVLCEGVEGVSAYSFMDCNALMKISLPGSLKTISMGAFSNCQSLTEVMIPANVSQLREGALGNCISIEHISVPKQIMEVIDAKWFNSCFHNVDLYLMWLKGCTNFDERVGRLCSKAMQRKKEEYISKFIISNDMKGLVRFLELIEKLTVEDMDRYIAVSTEKGYTEITSVLLAHKSKVFSPRIEEEKAKEQIEKELGIREYTLSDWRKIFKFTTVDGKTRISEIKGNTQSVLVPSKIGKNSVISVSISNCPWGRVINAEVVKTITEVVIESGVQEISKGAFAGCELLNAVSIPESIEKIGEFAFLGCRNLSELRIPCSVTEIGRHAFDSCSNLVIYAPTGSYTETYAKEHNIPFVAE